MKIKFLVGFHPQNEIAVLKQTQTNITFLDSGLIQLVLKGVRFSLSD